MFNSEKLYIENSLRTRKDSHGSGARERIGAGVSDSYILISQIGHNYYRLRIILYVKLNKKATTFRL